MTDAPEAVSPPERAILFARESAVDHRIAVTIRQMTRWREGRERDATARSHTIAAAIDDLKILWDRLAEPDRDVLLAIARALAGGVFQPRGLLSLVPFSTSQLRDAFERLRGEPHVVSITLTFPRGGNQAVKGVDAASRAREEDDRIVARR